MDLISLSVMGIIDVFLGTVALFYIRKLRHYSEEHRIESDLREKELKRKVLELQVIRSLGEKIDYSLDLKKMLDVTLESLKGLVQFSTVSYMVQENDNRVTFKIHLEEAVGHNFLGTIKVQMLLYYSHITRQQLPLSLVDEIVSGLSLDDRSSESVGSSFNLPVVINKKVVGIINISSSEVGLYKDQETAILNTILDQVFNHANKLSQVVENEKNKLSAMVSSLTDGVAMVDPSLSLIVANKAVGQLLNITDETDLLQILAVVREKIDLSEAIHQAIKSQDIVRLKEFEMKGKALQIDVEPVKDKYGYLLGAVVVIHDVTEAKNLEKMREDFTAMMVHELRTPLTTISYAISGMMEEEDGLSKEVLKQNLGVIKSTEEQMLGLVNELLDVAKIEAGKFVVNVTLQDLKKVISEKIASFKLVAEQKHLKLEEDVDQNLPQFNFDPLRIGQVLTNLLSNACKYTDSGEIVVRAYKREAEVIVEIRDSGDGIKKEDLPKLFSKFEQVGKGKTGERPGSGLGLVISRGIVEAHGGTMWVESEGEGKGSTFSFSLPAS